MYKGQELEYDGQRYDLEEIRMSDESSSIDDPILQKVEAAKEKIQMMKGQQEDEEELDETEIFHEKVDNVAGYVVLIGLSLMALYNMMKWGHI